MSSLQNAVDKLLPLPPVTFHILVALADEDRHGYAILQEIERRSSGEMRVAAGTLYRSIHRMLEQGLILELGELERPSNVEADDSRRRYYRLAPFGREVAVAEARRLGRMLQLARDGGLVLREGS